MSPPSWILAGSAQWRLVAFIIRRLGSYDCSSHGRVATPLPQKWWRFFFWFSKFGLCFPFLCASLYLTSFAKSPQFTWPSGLRRCYRRSGCSICSFIFRFFFSLHMRIFSSYMNGCMLCTRFSCANLPKMENSGQIISANSGLYPVVVPI